MNKRRHSRKRTGPATVNIHVRDLAQMFNSLDPSPFWDRDLDRDAARFVEEELSDKRTAERWHLHVQAQEDVALARDLQAAIENYYVRLAGGARRELKEHLRTGQLGLLLGCAVFLACMGLRRVLQSSFAGVPRMIDEGLIILAWLVLWRPAETLAYEWVPMHRRPRRPEGRRRARRDPAIFLRS